VTALQIADETDICTAYHFSHVCYIFHLRRTVVAKYPRECDINHEMNGEEGDGSVKAAQWFWYGFNIYIRDIIVWATHETARALAVSDMNVQIARSLARC